MDVKSFLKDKLVKLLNEAQIESHFEERFTSRIIKPEIVTVGFEIPQSRGQYEIVGTYKLSHDVKGRALDAFQMIVKTKYPYNQSLAIKIADIEINPALVNYKSGFNKEICRNKTLILVDQDTNTNGNILYCIIRNNQAKTIFYAKSYVYQSPDKMRVNQVVNDIFKYKPATNTGPSKY